MKKITALASLAMVTCIAFGFGQGQEVLFSIVIPMDDKPETMMGHIVIEYVVHKSGFACDVRHVYSWAHQGSRRHELTEDQLAKAKGMVASLPDSTVDMPKDKTVVVTSYTAEGRKRMVYDRLKLPKEMKGLFEILGGLREELKDKVDFILE